MVGGQSSNAPELGPVAPGLPGVAKVRLGRLPDRLFEPTYERKYIKIQQQTHKTEKSNIFFQDRECLAYPKSVWLIVVSRSTCNQTIKP